MRRLGFIGLAVLLLGGVAAFYTCSKGTIIPGTSPRPLAGVIDEPLATGDSTVIAGFARDRCRLLSGQTKRECYEEILLTMVERKQVHLAMVSLAELSRLDPSIDARGHDFVHVVGINAWTPGQDIGAIYDTCTELFQSGCYHGVIQAYMDAKGSDSLTVSTLCDQIASTRTNLWLRFQCVHGLGHGLVQAKALHLRRALEGCDWLASGWDEESCYGGAFMEFILAGRGQEHHPHHASGGADTVSAGAAEPADHDHQMAAQVAAAPPADTFAIRDPNDPLYPCTALGQRYQRSCYGMQAGIIYEQVGNDFAKIGAACDKAPYTMRPACYQGIGTYVSGVTVRDSDESIDLCMKGNPKWRAWCFVGVVKNFVDVTSDPTDGLAFCAMLTDHALGVSCYVAVGEEMAVLHTELGKRTELCERVPTAFQPSCRYGAGLTSERPSELPNYAPVES